MRWEDLFADLEGRFAHLSAADLAAEVADRTRAETAKLRLVDRLRPAIGQPVGLTTIGGHDATGSITAVGPDWVLLREQTGRECLVPLAAVTSAVGLGALSAAPGSAGRVAARLSLGYALRGIARDRAAVFVGLRDTVTLTGTIDRVGADFFEMAAHAVGAARRRGEVSGVRTVPFDGVAVVRRA